MGRVRVWLAIATSAPVVRRSLVACVLVGTILVAINHGEGLVHGRIDPIKVAQVALTFLVPFVVSMASSVAAIEASRAQHAKRLSSSDGGRSPAIPKEPATHQR